MDQSRNVFYKIWSIKIIYAVINSPDEKLNVFVSRNQIFNPMYQNDDGYYAMQVASYYFLHRKKKKNIIFTNKRFKSWNLDKIQGQTTSINLCSPLKGWGTFLTISECLCHFWLFTTMCASKIWSAVLTLHMYIHYLVSTYPSVHCKLIRTLFEANIV